MSINLTGQVVRKSGRKLSLELEFDKIRPTGRGSADVVVRPDPSTMVVASVTPEDLKRQVDAQVYVVHESRLPITLNVIKQGMRNVRSKQFGDPHADQWSEAAMEQFQGWLQSAKRRRTGLLVSQTPVLALQNEMPS